MKGFSWRKLLGSFAIVIVLFVAWQWELTTYLMAQGKGQFRVLWNARQVEEVMLDPAVDERTKRYLDLIADAKAFGERIGMETTSNYTTFFDHGTEPI